MKKISLLVCVTLCFMMSLSAANQKKKNAVQEIDTGTHTVTDFTGKQVEVPNTINRIVILGPLPLPSVLAVYQQGKVDNIVGIQPDSLNGAKNSIFAKYAPDFLNIETNFLSTGKVNWEEVVALNPDVIFYYNPQDEQMLEQLKIAGVRFCPPGGKDGSPLTVLEAWMDSIRQILQEDSPALDIIRYGKETEAKIKERIAAADVPNDNILILSNYTDTAVISVGKKSSAQYWINLVGGNNVGGEGMQSTLNLEQLYNQMPEQLYIMTFTGQEPGDIYNSTEQASYWQQIPAVQNKKVYKFPFGMHRWCPPTTDTPLAMWWMAKTARPELFKDVDLNKEIKSFYKKYYGMRISDKDVNSILNPSSKTKLSTNK